MPVAADVEDRARLGVGQHPPPHPVLGELAGQGVGDRAVTGQVGGLPAQPEQGPGGDGDQDLRALPAGGRAGPGGGSRAAGPVRPTRSARRRPSARGRRRGTGPASAAGPGPGAAPRARRRARPPRGGCRAGRSGPPSRPAPARRTRAGRPGRSAAPAARPSRPRAGRPTRGAPWRAAARRASAPAGSAFSTRRASAARTCGAVWPGARSSACASTWSAARPSPAATPARPPPRRPPPPAPSPAAGAQRRQHRRPLRDRQAAVHPGLRRPRRQPQRRADLELGHLVARAARRADRLRHPAGDLGDRLRLAGLRPRHQPLRGRQRLHQRLPVQPGQLHSGQRGAQIRPRHTFEHVFDRSGEPLRRQGFGRSWGQLHIRQVR